MVRLTQSHVDASYPSQFALGVQNLYRVGEKHELDTFLLGVFNFARNRRDFHMRTSIDQSHFFGTQPQSYTSGVYCGIAASDNHHSFADRDFLTVVHLLKEIHGVNNALNIFMR